MLLKVVSFVTHSFRSPISVTIRNTINEMYQTFIGNKLLLTNALLKYMGNYFLLINAIPVTLQSCIWF